MKIREIILIQIPDKMKYDEVVVLEHCKAPPRIEIRVANSTEAF